MKLWLSIAAMFLAAGTVMAEPQAHISCVAKHEPVVVYDREHKTSHEQDDWVVDCTIKIGEKQIFGAALPLLHPATYEEVMGAIEEFRKRKAPAIVKDYKEAK